MALKPNRSTFIHQATTDENSLLRAVLALVQILTATHMKKVNGSS